MKIYKKLEQKTDEWFKLRSGKLTASNAQAIANGGKGLQTLCLETVAELYSSTPKIQIENEHIQRGNELEAEARTIYEMETGAIVTEVGFVEMNEYVGCSPDGLIYEAENLIGGIEIKCPSNKTYLDVLLNETVDPKYYAQIQMQIFVCNLNWIDYVVYNPNFEINFYKKRIKPDIEYLAKLKTGIEKGTEIIKGLKEKMEQLNDSRKLQSGITK